MEISDPANFQEKIDKIKSAGLSSLHIVADFDKTLTTLKDGNRSSSSWGAFADLIPGYKEERQALFDKYYPFETDPGVPHDLRIRMMTEWYGSHLKLLVGHQITQGMIDEVVANGCVKVREGFEDLLLFAKERGIPMLIFSAGLGDVIRTYLERSGLFFPNLHLISNFFKFDPGGKAIGFDGEVIHSFNKTEERVKGKPYQAIVEKRKNVVLLGDGLGDITMADGERHDNIIKIGFLNGEKDHLEAFKQVFDAVIVEDKGLEDVLDLLRKVSAE